MRTTVEFTDEQHRALTALAARRRIRGFSPIVQEAVDAYLRSQQDAELEQALALRGALSDEEAAELRRRIDEAWSAWTSG